MPIKNNTDLIVEAIPVIGPGNKPFMTVIVKGTFDFAYDIVEFSSDQIPLFYTDEMFDDPGSKTLKFESDMVPFKPVTDIIVSGHATCQDGKKPFFDACILVGETYKTLRVFGNRFWEQKETFKHLFDISEPDKVNKMELRYETAFGGQSPDNCQYMDENIHGTGYIPKEMTKKANYVILPNIEDPNALIKKQYDTPTPTGLGFYPKNCEPRLSYLGTYDENWKKSVCPGYPNDFNFSFFNCAHPDLQTETYLKGNEPVELLNLTYDGLVSFNLPGINPVCQVRYRGMDAEKNLPLALDTLCFLTDEHRFYMVWRGLCPIQQINSQEIDTIRISAPDLYEELQYIG